VFAADGILYRQETIEAQSFIPVVNGDIPGQLNDTLNNQLLVNNSTPFTQFTYAKLRRFTTQDTDVNGSLLTVVWQQLTIATAQSTGYMSLEADYTNTLDINTGLQLANTISANPLKTGSASSNSLRYIIPGTIIRFRASPNVVSNPKYFNALNDIEIGTPSIAGDKVYLYATVVNVNGDGTGGGILTVTSQGPITLSTFVPTGAYVDQIIPAVSNRIPQTVLNSAATLINGKKNFGIRYDEIKQSWNIVQPQDLQLTQPTSSLINTNGVNAEYSDTYAGDISSGSLDSSWILSFVSGVYGYNIYYRQINYIFESVQETNFYYDSSVRVYDSKTGTTLTDQIKVLRSNSQPDANTALYEDKTYYIYKMIVDPDGRENTNKILLKFADTARAGVPDNPDLFEEIVNPATNTANNKYVFFQQNYNNNNFVRYDPLPANTVNVDYGSQGAIVQAYGLYGDGQLFFAYNENTFYSLSVTATSSGANIRTLTAYPNGTQYLWLYGRTNLYFQYRHASPANRRIDPSPNNIVDLFVLTKSYADDYQAWIKDTTGTVVQPTLPDTETLQLAYGALENYKTISDTVIYNSARFKPIIGSKSDPALQATIKVVKNAAQVISDNEVKTLVITAINKYFDVNNWDFGETFYFSELGAYLHSQLVPNVSSVIIVPNSTSQQFGSLYQINAEPDEIIISSATVDNVLIIPAITNAQL
jgi:hypothetical protein